MKKVIIFLCLIPLVSYGQSKKKQIHRLNEIVDSLKNEISIKISEIDSYKNELSLKISENDSLKKDSESFKRDVKELLLINSNLKFEIEKVIDSMHYEKVEQEIYFRGKEEDLYNKIDSLMTIDYDYEGVSYATVSLKRIEYIFIESNGESESGKYKLIFKEYGCSPECRYWGDLILYVKTERGEGVNNFWSENLEIWDNEFNTHHLFQIIYKDSEFIEIIY